MWQIFAVAVAGVSAILAVAVWKDKLDPREIVGEAYDLAVHVFYSPKYWLVLALPLGGYELVTGGVSNWFLTTQTEIQLIIIVAVGTLACGGYWLAGNLLHRVYDPDFRYMVVLNPEFGGDFDVLEGGSERFADMTVKGADELRPKKTPGGTRVGLARKYDSVTNTAVASWKALNDELEVERTATAIHANTKILENTLDEAREIRSAAVAYKQQIYDRVYSEVIDIVERYSTTANTDSQKALEDTVEIFETDDLAEQISEETATEPDDVADSEPDSDTNEND